MKQNRIAITGGIASGKTYVSNLIKKLGYPVISCDEINKELLNTKTYLEGLEKLFPNAFTKGKLDKQALRDIIFTFEDKRKELNSYSHSKIKERLVQQLDLINDKLVFVEVPVLNDSDYISLFNEVWIIDAKFDTKISRLMVRDNLTKEQAIQEINGQNTNYNFDIPVKVILNDKETDLEKEILDLTKSINS